MDTATLQLPCDTERCATCLVDTIEGVDQHGLCARCAGADSFTHMLRLMAAGVTRDRCGRFAKITTTTRQGN